MTQPLPPAPRPPSVRTWIVRGGLSLLVTGGILAWIATRVEPAKVGEAIVAFQVARGAVVVAIAAAVMLARAWRAQLLLPSGAPYRGVLSAVAIAFLVSTATPLRMGVVIRPWMLRDRCGVPFGAGVAAIVAERLLDLLSLLVVVAWVGAVALPQAGTEVLAVDVLARGLVSAATVGLVLLGTVAWMGPDRLTRRLTPWTEAGGVRAALAGGAITFAQGARGLAATPGRTLAAAGLTAGMTLAGMVLPWIVLGGFAGAEPTVARVTTFWVAAMTAVAAVPTPGSFGAYEAAGMSALQAFGVDPSTGTAATLVVHVGTFLTQVLIGAAFLARDGFPRVDTGRVTGAGSSH